MTQPSRLRDYPYTDGDTIVLGPEIFASLDGETISWRGRNYVPQRTGQTTLGTRRAPDLTADLAEHAPVIDGDADQPPPATTS